MSTIRCDAWVKGVPSGLSCWKLFVPVTATVAYSTHPPGSDEDVRLDPIMPLIVRVGIEYRRPLPCISFNYSSNSDRLHALRLTGLGADLTVSGEAENTICLHILPRIMLNVLLPDWATSPPCLQLTASHGHFPPQTTTACGCLCVCVRVLKREDQVELCIDWSLRI